MKLRIYGTPTKVNKSIIKDACHWYMKDIAPRMYKKLFIRLFFKKDFNKNTDTLAQVQWEDDNHRPREFTITVDSDLTYARMLRTLAHEIVHVKQWSQGEMRDNLRNSKDYDTVWRGVRYKSEDIDYWSLPWEIDATAMEGVLYDKYRQHLKTEKEQKKKGA
jgi:hypothetical protein